MHENTERTLLRDCEIIRIPSGDAAVIKAGTVVRITQALGGSYTIVTEQGLARITDANADAIGLESSVVAGAAGAEAGGAVDQPVEDKAVWDQLKTCYDPEIPVNIVDLGLVYDCLVTPRPGQGAHVAVKMTLTAPGCGMGPTIAAEARQKVLTVPGVSEADVELVWDPAWNQAMISEVGKMKMGLI